MERLLPGASGIMATRGFLATLGEIGFAGAVLLEPFNSNMQALPPPERAAAVAASLAPVWPR